MIEILINEVLSIILLYLLGRVILKLSRTSFDARKLFFIIVLVITSYYQLIFILDFFGVSIWLPIVFDINLPFLKAKHDYDVANLILNFIIFFGVNIIFLVWAITRLSKWEGQR